MALPLYGQIAFGCESCVTQKGVVLLKIVYYGTLGLTVGSNKIYVPIGSLSKGNFVVSLLADGKQYQQRFIKE